jgi:hypothetical protein
MHGMYACSSVIYRLVNKMNIVQARSEQIFNKSRRHLKILEARIVTWSKFHNEEPQIGLLGATVRNLVATATWHSIFVHPCYRLGSI